MLLSVKLFPLLLKNLQTCSLMFLKTVRIELSTTSHWTLCELWRVILNNFCFILSIQLRQTLFFYIDIIRFRLITLLNISLWLSDWWPGLSFFPRIIPIWIIPLIEFLCIVIILLFIVRLIRAVFSLSLINPWMLHILISIIIIILIILLLGVPNG